MPLDPAETSEVRLTVEHQHTAAVFGRESGERYPEVMATPVMIGEMERACGLLMRPLLQPGQVSVGARVEVKHRAPTPIGAEVVTRARFVEQDGRLYWFEVWSEDPGGEVGRGRHGRAIVDEVAIIDGAAARRPA